LISNLERIYARKKAANKTGRGRRGDGTCGSVNARAVPHIGARVTRSAAAVDHHATTLTAIVAPRPRWAAGARWPGFDLA
jgi:hypothetical protein